MASASENIEINSSPKKIIEKVVSDAVVEENGKQDECVTNGNSKSPEKSHVAVIEEDGVQLEDAQSPQETEVVEEEQAAVVGEDQAETAAAAVGVDAEENGEAAEKNGEAAVEGVEAAALGEELNDVAVSKTSPTKCVSPLKKKAEAGDAADEPDVKKARCSLEEKAGADTANNDTSADVVEASNGAVVEAAE